MSFINPDKLRSEVEARETRKLKSFEHILNMCYSKILSTNKQSDSCCCIFTCPTVVFGLPLFNIYECIQFIIVKLTDKGFDAHLAVPNNIYISWKIESNRNSGNNNNNHRKQIESNSSTNYRNTPGIEYYNTNNTNRNNKEQKNHKTLFGAKPPVQKKYKPIEEYNIFNIEEYDSNDIDLFRSKIDELII